MTMAAYELTHNGRTGVRKGIIFETDGQPNAAVAARPELLRAVATRRRRRPRPRTSRSSRSASGSTRRAVATRPARTRPGPGRARRRRPCWPAWRPRPIVGTTTVRRHREQRRRPLLLHRQDRRLDRPVEHLQGGRRSARQGRLAPRPALSDPGRHGGQPDERHRTSAGRPSRSRARSSPARRRSGSAGRPASSFTVTSDTTITATAPAGATGTTVDITVTTPGGTTTQVNADRFTYS